MARPKTKEALAMTESAARLDQIIRETALSRSAFARRIGMTPSGMSHIFLRGTKVSNVIFRAIASEFELSEENKKWLLCGGIRKGERLMPEAKGSKIGESQGKLHKSVGRPKVKEPAELPPCTERLKNVVEESGLSNTKFAQRLGMSSGGFGNLFLRGTKISGPLAKAIELEFGIDHQWLLDGEGPKDANVAKLMSLNLAPSSTPPCESKPPAALVTSDHNGAYNTKEVENLNSEAYRRYKSDGPQFLGDSSVDLKPQKIFYDPNVPLEELTEAHLWIGGSSTPRTVLKLIERLLRAERKIEKLEADLKYFSGQ